MLEQVITSQEIGNEIGLVSRQVSPAPGENGDIARNTSEGPPVIRDDNGKLYEIKGLESKKQIAIEVSKETYQRCRYLGKLK